jgi:DNA polymerase III alpha subunit (gram-positive type)
MADLWLILDVETTGLDPGIAGVWQLGAVLWHPHLGTGKGEIDHFENFARPEAAHWTEVHRALAREKSGLTLAEEALMSSQPPLPETIARLIERLCAWDMGKVPWRFLATSYNCDFERRFLDREPAAISRRAAEAGLDFRWGPCLMAAAVAALAPERERLSLQKACAALRIPWDGSHRALADARLAAQVGERLGVFAREEER